MVGKKNDKIRVTSVKKSSKGKKSQLVYFDFISKIAPK